MVTFHLRGGHPMLFLYLLHTVEHHLSCYRFDVNTHLHHRGRASRWSEATQMTVGPAKAIFWLALLASYNYVQALTLFLY